MAKAKKRAVSLGTLAARAMRRAVEGAIEEHRRHGVPMVIWRDGKVVQVPASRIRLR